MEEVTFLRKDSSNQITLIINGVSYRDSDRNRRLNTHNKEIEICNDPLEDHDNGLKFEYKRNSNSAEWIIDDSTEHYERSIEDVECDSFPLEDISPRKRVRHKFPNPDEWEQNRRKRLRQEGKMYVTKRGIVIPEKTFSIKTCNHCSEKCHEHFNAEELQEMFDNFWKMDLQNKRQYLSQLIEETKVKRVRTKSPHSRRSVTRHYYLIKNSSQRKKVCRGFFLEVFKVSSNFIRTVCKKRLKSGIVERDLRGIGPPHNKRPEIVRDFIRNHINQFRRPRSGSRDVEREYLPSSLTLKNMYNAYVNECEAREIQAEKYWLYADVFHRDFNLHFRKPMKCNDNTIVKSLTDKLQREISQNPVPQIIFPEQIIEDRIIESRVSTNESGDVETLEMAEESECDEIDYKSLYEKEVKKNQQLRKEIQRLTELLK